MPICSYLVIPGEGASAEVKAMHAIRWAALAGAAVLVVVAPIQAQVRTTLHGEVRPRYELRNPAGPAGGPDEFTSMRVRLGLEAVVDANLTVFAQLQDVRLWGEETHPLFDYRADNLDLHQGYIRYRGGRLDWLTATIGRMEATFGGERLIGPIGWTQQGQSFDGVRADAAHGRGNVAVIAYRIGEETATSVAADSELYGTYATLRDVGPGSLDVYWLYDRTEGAVETDQHTLGSRYAFTVAGDIEGRVEGTLQRGTRNAVDVDAHMFGVRLGKGLLDGRASVTLWYDYLSGDDAASAATEVFQTLFATNHKFYGLADVFLDLPAHTAGSGLQDMAVKLSWRPTDAIGLGADVHSFRAAKQRALSGSHFGEEIDLTVSHCYSSYLTATGGFSYVFQDDPLLEVGRLQGDLRWFYLMLSASF